MIKIINVKLHNNTSEYAIYLTEMEILNSQKANVRVLIIIHGYGSSGQGGVIKEELLNYLQSAKKFHKIIDFVKGEEWSDSNNTKIQLCRLYPQLILNSQIQNQNSGVTIVWIW